MKSVGVVLLALLVLLSLLLSGCDLPGGPTPTPEPTPVPRSTQVVAALTPYVPADGLFAIGYPTDWRVNEADQQVEFSDSYRMLHIMVQYANAGQTMDEATMRTLIDNYFSAGMGAVTGFKREKDALQDDGSILVEYSFTNAGTPGYGSSLFLQRGSTLYILSFWVMQQDLWAPNQAFFGAVAESFQPTP